MSGIMAIGSFVIAAASFVISALQFMEKGFLFTNTYGFVFTYDSEYAGMDKKPFYRQAAITFAMVGVAFLLIAVECLAETGWLWAGVLGLTPVMIAYVIVSTVRIAKIVRQRKTQG